MPRATTKVNTVYKSKFILHYGSRASNRTRQTYFLDQYVVLQLLRLRSRCLRTVNVRSRYN